MITVHEPRRRGKRRGVDLRCSPPTTSPPPRSRPGRRADPARRRLGGEQRLSYEDTLPVTMDEMLHHTGGCPRRERAMVVGDLPVPLVAGLARGRGPQRRPSREGGRRPRQARGPHLELVHRLVEIGIPVMAHVGLTPQSVHAMGGYGSRARRGRAPRGRAGRAAGEGGRLRDRAGGDAGRAGRGDHPLGSGPAGSGSEQGRPATPRCWWSTTSSGERSGAKRREVADLREVISEAGSGSSTRSTRVCPTPGTPTSSWRRRLRLARVTEERPQSGPEDAAELVATLTHEIRARSVRRSAASSPPP